MAVSLLAHLVSDLCLGRPTLRALTTSATIADALSLLKNSEENFVSVWNCSHNVNKAAAAATVVACECQCVGKVCMVDVILHLFKDENLLCPSNALKQPVSVLLTKLPLLVMHVDPSCSLVEAIDLMLEGAQNLIVPVKNNRLSTKRKQHQKFSSSSLTNHNGQEFCWLTQEDIIRFILSSIGLFSPTPALSIESLGIISADVVAVDYHAPATLALEAVSRSLVHQTSVAVVDSGGILIGEISPLTLGCCDETVAAAITTLSCGDLMAYIDCGGPPEDLVRVVKERLRNKGLDGMLEHFDMMLDLSTTSSSDEESMVSGKVTRSGRHSRSKHYSARMTKRAEAIVCHPKSSLMAAMIQAIAHRVNYVWVIEDDCSLTGTVTFTDMIKVFREHLGTIA